MRDILVKRIEVLSKTKLVCIVLIEPNGINHGCVFDVGRMDFYGLWKLCADDYAIYNQILDTLEYHFKHKPKNASIINFKEPFKATVR